jgi:quercetin 2,3-dioxygenase
LKEDAVPTITPERWTDLTRIASPNVEGAVERPVKVITTAPKGFEGEGFPVRRAFAGV